jgi:hypothetical protein
LPRLKLVLAKAGDEKPARDGRLFFAVMGRCADTFIEGCLPVRKSSNFQRGLLFAG